MPVRDLSVQGNSRLRESCVCFVKTNILTSIEAIEQMHKIHKVRKIYKNIKKVTTG